MKCDTGALETTWGQCQKHLPRPGNLIVTGSMFFSVAPLNQDSLLGMRCVSLAPSGTWQTWGWEGASALKSPVRARCPPRSQRPIHLPAFLLAHGQAFGLLRGARGQLARVHIPAFLGRTGAALLRSEALQDTGLMSSGYLWPFSPGTFC